MSDFSNVDQWLSALSEEDMEYAMKRMKPMIAQLKVEAFVKSLNQAELEYTLAKARAMLGQPAKSSAESGIESRPAATRELQTIAATSPAANGVPKTVYLPERVRGKQVIVCTKDAGRYRVDNSELKSTRDALSYRRSTRIDDLAEDVPALRWGSVVEGVLQDGWLRVEVQAAESGVESGRPKRSAATREPQTFMAESPAANASTRTVYLPEHVRGKRVIFNNANVGSYYIDNFELQSERDALSYRHSKRFDDFAEDVPALRWGSSVGGVLEDGWLRVEVEGGTTRSRSAKPKPKPTCCASFGKMIHHGCSSNGPAGVKATARRAVTQ